MNLTEQEVVLGGMWTTINRLHQALHTTATMAEWLYDHTPERDRLEAAQRMDAFNKMLASVDEMVEPIRQAMETEVRNGKGSNETR